MEIERLLELSMKQHASDLHIVPDAIPLLRVHGSLIGVKEYRVLTAEDTKSLLYSVMTEDQKASFEKKLILEMALQVPKIGNFRVSVVHQSNGIAGVFRLIPEKVPSFEELGIPQVVKSLLGLSYGLVLVTGPTGSGKTTTLAAMVDYINSYRASNIITIEDPIEFVFKNKKSIISQQQVGRDTPDFPTALRASLRQDPNVILIGELRDVETMRLAMTAAETGHLVLATMHAASAPMAVSRFTEVFPTEEKNMVRSLLAETLQAIICQGLVRRSSGQGRVATFEIMLATEAIRHFIKRDMPTHMESTMQTSGDKGMCTMEQHLNELVMRGIVTSGMAQTIITNRSSFRSIDEKNK